MPRARANGIEIEYETFGEAKAPPLLLVTGFSLQMIAWDVRFCGALAARGFRVIRFDNRDVGLSTKLEDRGVTNIAAIMGGDASSAVYSLDDMADDAAGLLDALAVPAAHVVGTSMGGMIAQLLAIRHPSRARSLASIMSTTGDRSVGQPHPSALAVLFTPVAADREGNIARGVGFWRILTSPRRAFDEPGMREVVTRAYDRSFYPAGAVRQLAAILTARDRTRELAALNVPTLVIHGEDDPLVTPGGGEATARAIRGAKLLTIAEMGHELPEEHWAKVIDAIAANAARAQ
jgi:pimeloyl-ACP methyl ester carboxylesterase